MTDTPNAEPAITGSCLCGATKIAIAGALRSVRLCHCKNCVKFAGTSPAAWAMAQSSEFQVADSDTPVTKFNSGAGLRCFCSACGSSVWFESFDFPDVVGIPLGVVDTGWVPNPEFHLWTDSNPTWCRINDGLPKFPQGPEALS